MWKMENVYEQVLPEFTGIAQKFNESLNVMENFMNFMNLFSRFFGIFEFFEFCRFVSF